MPGTEVIAVIGQLLPFDIEHMGIRSEVIPICRSSIVCCSVEIGVRTSRLDIVIPAHLHKDAPSNERPKSSAKVGLIVGNGG